MFRKTLIGIETWELHDKVFINYINPKNCLYFDNNEPIETIIVVRGTSYVMNGDFRELLLETEGNLLKLYNFYQQYVKYDKNCRKYTDMKPLIGNFYKNIKRYLPRKKKVKP